MRLRDIREDSDIPQQEIADRARGIYRRAYSSADHGN